MLADKGFKVNVKKNLNHAVMKELKENGITIVQQIEVCHNDIEMAEKWQVELLAAAETMDMRKFT